MEVNSAAGLFLVSLLLASGRAPADPALFVHGLPEGWRAELFAEGIPGADGIIVDNCGNIIVASETTGRVLILDEQGNSRILTRDLRNPEGLCLDPSGSVYAVEDVNPGRALLLADTPVVITDSLVYPEGIAFSDGGLYITESEAENAALPPIVSRIVSSGPEGESVVFESLYLWSFSDLTVNDQGIIYVCNELSGLPLITASIIALDPVSGEWNVFCSGLNRCEGIGSTPGSFFPLYVAEEDVGDGSGRISIVESDGSSRVLAGGFGNVEDVAVHPDGDIYVTDDTRGAVIRITGP